MEKRHVTKNYPDWAEGKLNARKQEQIETHLQDCPNCRRYYEKMSAVFAEKADLSALPLLEADPFLPTRIKALADERTKLSYDAQEGRQWAGTFRLTISTMIIVAALAIGIFLGKDLATAEQYSESDLISDYYQAFAQQSYAANWESILEENNGGTP
jgi:predicted anti-sigma-YlaC factor YlaD